MSTTITFHFPAALRTYCGGARQLMVAAKSVRGLLEELSRIHPVLHSSVCDETGALRRHINLFVNSSFIADREGLDTTLAPGDVVSIMTAVSGG